MTLEEEDSPRMLVVLVIVLEEPTTVLRAAEGRVPDEYVVATAGRLELAIVVLPLMVFENPSKPRLNSWRVITPSLLLSNDLKASTVDFGPVVMLTGDPYEAYEAIAPGGVPCHPNHKCNGP